MAAIALLFSKIEGFLFLHSMFATTTSQLYLLIVNSLFPSKLITTNRPTTDGRDGRLKGVSAQCKIEGVLLKSIELVKFEEYIWRFAD